MARNERVRLLLVAAISAALAWDVGIAIGGWNSGPFQPSTVFHQMPEADFSNFWAAGRLGWAGRAADAYDLDLFQAWKEKVLAPGLALLPWLYPPLLAAAWVLPPLFAAVPGLCTVPGPICQPSTRSEPYSLP